MEKSLVTPKIFNFGLDKDDALLLDCGELLYDVDICYETYGKINKSKSNAVLILHALTGDAHAAMWHSNTDRKPGWWDAIIGPNKAIDTNKYFVVCSNILGGCSGTTGPRSINPATKRPYNMSFPMISIADMVRAQYRLMQHLNIPSWLSVIGGSMGGMQAIEWALSYPELVRSVVPIATTTSLSPQSLAFDWVGREAIMADKNWQNGNYSNSIPEHGLAIARMLAHITHLSTEAMDKKFGRNLQNSVPQGNKYNFKLNFAVESYLAYQGERFVERFDANSYLYITRAMDYFDIAARYDGLLEKAFENIKHCAFLVVAFSSDWLFPVVDSKRLVQALLKNILDVTFCEIESGYGHDAFLLETETLGSMLQNFLDNHFEDGLDNAKKL